MKLLSTWVRDEARVEGDTEGFVSHAGRCSEVSDRGCEQETADSSLEV